MKKMQKYRDSSWKRKKPGEARKVLKNELAACLLAKTYT